MTAPPLSDVRPREIPWPAGARQNGRLTIGGIPVDRLAARVGSTPFFAYDRALVTERVQAVRSALPPQVELSYALKANPMPALVQHLAGLVDGFDVASAGELAVALDTPVPPERISFAGPGKTPAEIRQAVAAGVVVTVESANQAQSVVACSGQLGVRPRLAVRVNPDFEIRGAGMRMGGGPRQFGVDVEQVPPLLEWLHRRGAEVMGFHVFAGSQILDAGTLVTTLERTADLLVRLSVHAHDPVRYLNLGGGFGIPYFTRDTPLDLSAVGAAVTMLVTERLKPVFPRARFVIELGRYLVGEAGVYLTRVVDRKVSRGTTYLVVDGGLHHQLAATGNLGQVVRRNYPIAVANRIDEPATEQVTVVGCLCTPLDVLGDRVMLPHADVGDLIAVFDAGAYGLTASPTGFLSHPVPAEVLV